MKRLTYDIALANDLSLFVDRLGETCGYTPCAELRMTQDVVLEMLDLCRRMNPEILEEANAGE